MDHTPVITRLDAVRLRSLLCSTQSRGLNRHYLETKLRQSKVVDAAVVPRDRVGVNSTFIVRERHSNVCWIYTLVMPRHADVTTRRISVISPLGAALLGQRAGDEVELRVAGGLVHMTIEAVRQARIPTREQRHSNDWLSLA
jgi:regulator of nucleoside diphosphate kinase